MEYDIGPDESVSTAVVLAVSALVGREACSLRPLDHVLDTDALDALFGPRINGHARKGGSLSFVYTNCRVEISNGEYLSIEPLETVRQEALDR